MKSYSEIEVFSREELALMRRAGEIVESLPDLGPGGPLRCHEVARAVGRILGLQVQDGFYGFVDHSWLWTKPLDHEELIGRTGFPNVLDPYCVGGMPAVRLAHAHPSLPHVGWAYRPDRERTDVDAALVDRLVEAASAFCRSPVRP